MAQRNRHQYAARWLIVLVLLTALSACRDEGVSSAAMPTLMTLPSLTPSETVIARVPPTRELHWVMSPTLSPTDAPPTSTATVTDIPTITPAGQPSATYTSTIAPTATITPTPRNSPTPTNTIPPTQAGDAAVIGENGVNLRPGPGRNYSPPIALLAPATELILIGRTSDSRWYEAQTFSGQRGWVSADLVTPRRDIASLPVTWIVEPTLIPVVVPTVSIPLGEVPPPQYLEPIPPSSAEASVPGLGISQRVRQIFQAGRQRGNRPNVFSKVGDSTTATQPFLVAFGIGTSDYDLGPYGYLQETINYFSVSPRGGMANSFVNQSLAASSAFNAAAVLASIWADDQVCQPNESPLLCEYRISRPSVAIIMLGAVDMQIYDAAQFRQSMDTIVATTIEQGVIPVLTTFPSAPEFHGDKAEEFNGIIREIASREQIPLIDLRAATWEMPHYGVGTDNFHLSHRGDGYTTFNGEENQWGLTRRNLLTLHTLDVLRREVLTR